MLRIGLTGGIGVGKSTVARIFEVLGIPVYYADEAAKQLMGENEELKSAIIKSFGKESYSSGVPDRKFIAGAVFNDEVKLKVLNALVHPATLKHAEEWFGKQTAPYVIKEAALIFESGSNKMLDYVIGVKAPLDLRIQRAAYRDHVSSAEIISRINKQMNEEEKIRLCDYVIVNDEQQLLIPQVLALHENFLKVSTPFSAE